MTRRLLVVASFVSALAFPALPASAGGGAHCEPPLEDKAVTEVAMKFNCFSPGVVRVPVGGVVRFRNMDSVEHNVTPAQQAFRGVHNLAIGADAQVTFPQAGVFPYACTLHPLMIGAVVVGDSAPDASAAQPAVQPAAATSAEPAGGGGRALWPFVLGVLLLFTSVGRFGFTRRRKTAH